MLRYCPKCGRVFMYVSYLPEKKCDVCQTIMRTVPNKYYEPPSSEYKLSDEMEQKLFEELVIPSDEFDQQLFDQRDNKVQQMLNKRNRIQSQIEARKAGNASSITCPYCKSTNVSKISTLGRSISVGLFGLASGKVGKQWHCNGCKSDF